MHRSHESCTALPKETLQAQAYALIPADSLCGTPGMLLTERAGGMHTGTQVLAIEEASTPVLTFTEHSPEGTTLRFSPTICQSTSSLSLLTWQLELKVRACNCNCLQIRVQLTMAASFSGGESVDRATRSRERSYDDSRRDLLDQKGNRQLADEERGQRRPYADDRYRPTVRLFLPVQLKAALMQIY